MKYSENNLWADRHLFSAQEQHDWEEFTKLATGWDFNGGHTPKYNAYDVSGSVHSNPVVIELKERKQEYDSYIIEIERHGKIYEALHHLAKDTGVIATPFYVNFIKGQRKAIIFNLDKCTGLRPQKKPKSENPGYGAVDDNNYAYFIPAALGKVICY